MSRSISKGLQAALAGHVENARTLQTQIKDLQTQIGSKQKLLEALKPFFLEHRDLAEVSTTEGGGTTWDFGGVQVCAPAPGLAGELTETAADQLRELAPRKFGKLFRVFYRLQPNFRTLAFQHLPSPTAKKLIAAVELPGKERVIVQPAEEVSTGH